MKRNWESSTTIQKKLKTTLTELREGVKGIKKKKKRGTGVFNGRKNERRLGATSDCVYNKLG